jgi:hypothetical protein
MGSLRFGPLVGFFPLSWHYAIPNGAFLIHPGRFFIENRTPNRIFGSSVFWFDFGF